MWLWGTLFDLGKTVFRGIGCLYAGAIGIIMTGGLITAIATSAVRHNPEAVAAVAVEAASGTDLSEAREWARERDRYRHRRSSVAAQWERDRRERELEEAYGSSYEDDY